MKSTREWFREMPTNNLLVWIEAIQQDAQCELQAELEAARREKAQLAAALCQIRQLYAGPDIAAHPKHCDCPGCISRNVLTRSTALRDLLLPIWADVEAIANLSATTGLTFEAQSFKATEIAQQILIRLRELCQ